MFLPQAWPARSAAKQPGSTRLSAVSLAKRGTRPTNYLEKGREGGRGGSKEDEDEEEEAGEEEEERKEGEVWRKWCGADAHWGGLRKRRSVPPRLLRLLLQLLWLWRLWLLPLRLLLLLLLTLAPPGSGPRLTCLRPLSSSAPPCALIINQHYIHVYDKYIYIYIYIYVYIYICICIYIYVIYI